jgi:hypothetical protein
MASRQAQDYENGPCQEATQRRLRRHPPRVRGPNRGKRLQEKLIQA